jgi:hypothetical protein
MAAIGGLFMLLPVAMVGVACIVCLYYGTMWAVLGVGLLLRRLWLGRGNW